jgi:hypothetical protein
MLYQIEFEKDAVESAGCDVRGWNPASLAPPITHQQPPMTNIFDFNFFPASHG